jgi:uncharacterized coiled-coil protein SlyX
MPTDWRSQLDAANRRIAELESKISAQNEVLRRLSLEGAGTQVVTRMLDVLNENLERASIYKQFIESRIAPPSAAAPDSEQRA